MVNILSFPEPIEDSELQVEESENRKALTHIQSELDAKTEVYFKERNTRFVPVQANEPEDLLHLANDEPEWYFQTIQNIIEIRASSSQNGLSIALWMVPDWIPDAQKNDEAIKIYFDGLSKVYAERMWVKNELDKENKAKIIYKKLLAEWPYIKAALEKLTQAQVTARQLNNLERNVKKSITEIVDNSNENQSGNVHFHDFWTRTTQTPDPLHVTEKDDEPIIDPELFMACSEYVDARNFKDILIPLFVKDNLLTRKIGKNFNKTEIYSSLKRTLREYETDPKILIELDERAIFQLLSYLNYVKDLTQLVDGYKRGFTFMSLSKLVDNILEEIVMIYSYKYFDEYDSWDIIAIWAQLQELSWTLDQL